jgi:hypothetical protein
MHCHQRSDRPLMRNGNVVDSCDLTSLSSLTVARFGWNSSARLARGSFCPRFSNRERNPVSQRSRSAFDARGDAARPPGRILTRRTTSCGPPSDRHPVLRRVPLGSASGAQRVGEHRLSWNRATAGRTDAPAAPTLAVVECARVQAGAASLTVQRVSSQARRIFGIAQNQGPTIARGQPSA